MFYHLITLDVISERREDNDQTSCSPSTHSRPYQLISAESHYISVFLPNFPDFGGHVYQGVHVFTRMGHVYQQGDTYMVPKPSVHQKSTK